MFQARRMAIVYIGIGSNLGDRKRNCRRAVELLRREGVRVAKASSLHETGPWGVVGQPDFINMAVEAETALSPRELLVLLKSMEKEMGREEGVRWGPRVIDLDILLYEGLVLEEPGLRIPHPLMHLRGFVLGPLAEIAPGVMHPVLGKSIRDITLALREEA